MIYPMGGPDHPLQNCGPFLYHTMKRRIEKRVTYLQRLLLWIPLPLGENHPRLQEIPLGTPLGILPAFLPVAFSFLLPPAVGKRKERKTIEGLCEILMHNGCCFQPSSYIHLKLTLTTKQTSISHLSCFFLCFSGSFTDHREENEQRRKMVNHHLRADVIPSEEKKWWTKKNG